MEENDRHKKKKSGERKHPKYDAAKKLELLITVADRRKGEFYADFLQSFEVNMQMICFGSGTAKTEMLRLLGLDSQKAVIFSVIREDMAENALSALGEKFETIKNGKGIAFTVPMSSVIGVAIYGFLSNNLMTVKEG